MRNRPLYDFFIESLKKENGGTLRPDLLMILRDCPDIIENNLRSKMLRQIEIKYVFATADTIGVNYDTDPREFVQQMKIDFAAEIAALPPAQVQEDSVVPA